MAREAFIPVEVLFMVVMAALLGRRAHIYPYDLCAAHNG